MKKIVFTEPAAKFDSFIVYEKLREEAPEWFEIMRREGALALECYGWLQGLYIPRSVTHITEGLCYYFELPSKSFIVLPPNLTAENYPIFRTLLYCDQPIYVEKGSPTEKVLLSRKLYTNIRHGLPVVNGKRIEHSGYVTMWIKGEGDDESENATQGGTAGKNPLTPQKMETALAGFVIVALMLILFAKLM